MDTAQGRSYFTFLTAEQRDFMTLLEGVKEQIILDYHAILNKVDCFEMHSNEQKHWKAIVGLMQEIEHLCGDARGRVKDRLSQCPRHLALLIREASLIRLIPSGSWTPPLGLTRYYLDVLESSKNFSLLGQLPQQEATFYLSCALRVASFHHPEKVEIGLGGNIKIDIVSVVKPLTALNDEFELLMKATLRMFNIVSRANLKSIQDTNTVAAEGLPQLKGFFDSFEEVMQSKYYDVSGYIQSCRHHLWNFHQKDLTVKNVGSKNHREIAFPSKTDSLSVGVVIPVAKNIQEDCAHPTMIASSSNPKKRSFESMVQSSYGNLLATSGRSNRLSSILNDDVPNKRVRFIL